ncbi:hypothetical protein E6O75_ATG03882 [Venturia nashicola]|uniref:Uncharacterized protein n=1 Tax=Venturia nashicola TaxID=86259 RepID=A0A4Z1PET3_9PEZI|nr:hypothetical protein E6O75_ATG03882 [Venturia nashicola]
MSAESLTGFSVFPLQYTTLANASATVRAMIGKSPSPSAYHAKPWSSMTPHQQWDLLAATGLQHDDKVDNCKKGEEIKVEEWPWARYKNCRQYGKKQKTH